MAIGGLLAVLIQACSLPTEGSSVGVNGIYIVRVGSVFAEAPACSPLTSWLIQSHPADVLAGQMLLDVPPDM